MFNRVRLWWKYDGRYLHKDFVNGIKNLWKWFPTIWKQRDWDHHFIYTILAKKLEFQAKYISEKNRHTTAQQDAERMRLVVKLIKLEQDESYNMEYMEYAENKHWFEPCEDKPGYSTWESENVWERYDEYFAKYPLCYKRAVQYIKDHQKSFTNDHTDKQLVAMIMGDLRQAKCKELIFKIMSQDINKWWD
jgi:hypothetical protein